MGGRARRVQVPPKTPALVLHNPVRGPYLPENLPPWYSPYHYPPYPPYPPTYHYPYTTSPTHYPPYADLGLASQPPISKQPLRSHPWRQEHDMRSLGMWRMAGLLDWGKSEPTAISCPTSMKQGQKIKKEMKSRLEEDMEEGTEMEMMTEMKIGVEKARRQAMRRNTPRKRVVQKSVAQHLMIVLSTPDKLTGGPLFPLAGTVVKKPEQQ